MIIALVISILIAVTALFFTFVLRNDCFDLKRENTKIKLVSLHLDASISNLQKDIQELLKQQNLDKQEINQIKQELDNLKSETHELCEDIINKMDSNKTHFIKELKVIERDQKMINNLTVKQDKLIILMSVLLLPSNQKQIKSISISKHRKQIPMAIEVISKKGYTFTIYQNQNQLLVNSNIANRIQTKVFNLKDAEKLIKTIVSY